VAASDERRHRLDEVRPGERLAEAEVGATAPERHVVIGGAADIEGEGLVEHGVVAVG